MAQEINTNPFEVGEVVVLNGGGPPMTIIKRGAGDVVCVWFVPSGQPLSGPFDMRAVHKVTKTGKPELRLARPDEANETQLPQA